MEEFFEGFQPKIQMKKSRVLEKMVFWSVCELCARVVFSRKCTICMLFKVLSMISLSCNWNFGKMKVFWLILMIFT